MHTTIKYKIMKKKNGKAGPVFKHDLTARNQMAGERPAFHHRLRPSARAASEPRRAQASSSPMLCFFNPTITVHVSGVTTEEYTFMCTVTHELSA